MVAAMLMLSACNSPDFVNPPPASYFARLPEAINGNWKNEEDNGTKVRLQNEPGGKLSMYFSTPAEGERVPPGPLVAQTLHFGGADWLLLDMRKMAEWQGESYTENAQYVLMQVTLENPDRVCGTELSTTLFMQAIQSGELSGTVVQPNPYMSPKVIVAASGADWVKWWLSLPESKRSYGPRWCFLREK